MTQRVNSVSDRISPRPPAVDAVKGASTNLSVLSLRYSELSRDVARLRYLLEDLAQQVASPREKQRPASKRLFRNPTPWSDDRRQSTVKSGSPQKTTNCEDTLVVRSRLERACIIALMETSGPVAVETLYDRIKRRGSFAFEGYKHPFRAILLAMGAIVKRGEAILSNEGGHRRWRWEPESALLEQPRTSSVA
jgi:hypothetical protein